MHALALPTAMEATPLSKVASGSTSLGTSYPAHSKHNAMEVMFGNGRHPGHHALNNSNHC